MLKPNRFSTHRIDLKREIVVNGNRHAETAKQTDRHTNKTDEDIYH